ncbi:hypothetical protein J1N10_00160 [Carboxylicivirga sp. A043]|uniref:hypothetical protein n=1 Tax=Carboxylicivirga litoralis TaxID=2816963 RepID=UPI0021CB710C|nr:hypothetical protein [Carboxylicivirga sp. A043]MCU4154372.1 hypothetical protein [Carboxylicivirga sp. A043]
MENNQIIKEVSIEHGKVLINQSEFFTGETSDLGPFLKSLYKQLNLKYNKYFKMDHLSKLGFLASEVLLLNEGIANETDEVAIILANASSSLHTDVKYQESIADIPSPSVFVYTLPNIVIGEISIRNKFYGEHMFFVQPSYNKEELLDYTTCLFNSTPCKYAIVGWVEVNRNGDYSAKLMLCQNKK